MSQDQASLIYTLSQIHNGETHIGDYLKLIFRNTPVITFWYDTNFVVGGCNENSARAFEKSYPEDIIGKTDLDFALSDTDAACYLITNQKVIKENKPQFNVIDPMHTSDGVCTLWSTTKMPFYDVEGNILGIVGFAMPIHRNVEGFSNAQLLNLYQSFKDGKNYYVYIHGRIVHLTTRQAEILMHLSMGKTFKEIARLIDRAVSTVEDHIDVLKRKLGVYTASELIDCFWKNPIKWF